MNNTLQEKDLTPFVLDKYGKEIKIGDTIRGEGCWDFKVVGIVGGGEIDQEPLLKLEKVTYRLPSEISKNI
jgi:hypothetical protein